MGTNVNDMGSNKDTQLIAKLVNSIDKELENTEFRAYELRGQFRNLASSRYEEFEAQPKERRQDIIEQDSVSARIEQLEKRRLDLVMEIQKQDSITEKLSEMIASNKSLYAQIKEHLSIRAVSRCMLSDDMELQLARYTIENSNTIIDELDLNIFNLFQNIHKLELQLNKIIAKGEEENKIMKTKEFQEELNKLIKLFNVFFNEYTLKQKVPDS